MGLGKTAQTLAHLLLEKEAGRLDKPALIILPTSLIFNWKNEAARFAPDLKVLSLHGPERKVRFPEIMQHDVVLTNLVARGTSPAMQSALALSAGTVQPFFLPYQGENDRDLQSLYGWRRAVILFVCGGLVALAFAPTHLLFLPDRKSVV